MTKDVLCEVLKSSGGDSVTQEFKSQVRDFTRLSRQKAVRFTVPTRLGPPVKSRTWDLNGVLTNNRVAQLGNSLITSLLTYMNGRSIVLSKGLHKVLIFPSERIYQPIPYWGFCSF